MPLRWSIPFWRRSGFFRRLRVLLLEFALCSARQSLSVPSLHLVASTLRLSGGQPTATGKAILLGSACHTTRCADANAAPDCQTPTPQNVRSLVKRDQNAIQKRPRQLRRGGTSNDMRRQAKTASSGCGQPDGMIAQLIAQRRSPHILKTSWAGRKTRSRGLMQESPASLVRTWSLATPCVTIPGHAEFTERSHRVPYSSRQRSPSCPGTPFRLLRTSAACGLGIIHTNTTWVLMGHTTHQSALTCACQDRRRMGRTDEKRLVNTVGHCAVRNTRSGPRQTPCPPKYAQGQCTRR